MADASRLCCYALYCERSRKYSMILMTALVAGLTIFFIGLGYLNKGFGLYDEEDASNYNWLLVISFGTLLSTFGAVIAALSATLWLCSVRKARRNGSIELRDIVCR